MCLATCPLLCPKYLKRTRKENILFCFQSIIEGKHTTEWRGPWDQEHEVDTAHATAHQESRASLQPSKVHANLA